MRVYPIQAQDMRERRRVNFRNISRFGVVVLIIGNW